jgi:5-carboxyvanillate decarboxylase
LREVARSPGLSLDLPLVQGIYDPPADGPRVMDFLEDLIDLEGKRLKDMDENGVDVHLLSLTAPGVQMFDADTATDLAALANDRLAEVISRHPTRFAGLASMAPQSPKRAVNEYLDDPKYFPILEAAEALDGCIYIHPRAPSDGLAAPFRHYNLDNAMWGYGVEVATHAVRLIVSGVFDHFPKLKICLGHMGEAVHFWLWRIDFMHARAESWGRVPKLKLKPSDYFKRNFVITTSGVEAHEALDYSIKVLGADKVLWAIDYPYQPTAPAVQFMDSAPISDADKEKIYHANAERVFHIEA